MNRKIITGIEIAILVLVTFSISYLTSENNINDRNLITSESNGIVILRAVAVYALGGNLVSAQSIPQVWTCPQNVNGTLCQEYPSDICNSQCSTSCFQGPSSQLSSCTLGTCIDPEEGTCLPNTPKAACENLNGTWSLQAPGQCNKGCCLLGNQAQYVTELTCQNQGNLLGLPTSFQPVSNELQCLAMAQVQEQGACVKNSGIENSCSFGTKSDCIAKNGQFYLNYLCSNPELNTNCEKQSSTACLPGKDEVYWIDSCGNKENIYDADKTKSWNEGKVLPKSQSCNPGLPGSLAQATCGNCNYLLGSVCGPFSGGDQQPSYGSYVCKDLSCNDNGKIRKNGESWCAFDSAIGVDGADGSNEQRSVDLPGSLHYRKTCSDGKITTENCGDFRNLICSEQSENDFSSAACRVNRWQACQAANTDLNELNKCEDNTDCFLKHVEITDTFKFDVCAPKYPPGFDFSTEKGGVAAKTLCSIGTISCTRVEQKDFFGNWKCKANCECTDKKFTETLNNLCISLGDCGGNINLQGEFIEGGYGVDNAPWLDSGYKDDLTQYKNPKPGQKVEPITAGEAAALFGVNPPTLESAYGDILQKVGYGAMGVGAASALWGIAASPGFFGTEGGINVVSQGGVDIITETSPQILAPTFSAFASAVGIAAMGFSIGSLVATIFGYEDEAAFALIAAGLLGSGLVIGLALAGIGPFSGGLTSISLFSLAAFLPALFIVAAFVGAMLLYLQLAGVGKTREIKVDFKCMPWQASAGSDSCEQCGKNGLPCTPYKCSSYGQNCQLVNEGSPGKELCVNANPNDVSGPKISPNYASAINGTIYVENGNGFKVKKTDSECIPAFTPILVGISLNEAGQCKVSTEHTSSFDNMQSFFGDDNLYKYNHDMQVILPSLSSLGVYGIDPNRTAEFNLYVRCQDANANKNVQEYTIQTCVSPEKDITAPVIMQFNPQSPAYAAFNGTEKNISFVVNEPATCKWSNVDEDYDLMPNSATCDVGIEPTSPFGWVCLATIPLLGDETTSYFRCKDQPWLIGNDDESRNVNSQSVGYLIKKSLSNLKIDSVTPVNQTLKTANFPLNVDLKAITSGGVNGNAMCKFRALGNDQWIDFLNTGGKIHIQPFSLMLPGTYNWEIQCKDGADNYAQSGTSFNVEIDSLGPEVTRVYLSNSGLIVITNEASTCAYSNNDCEFAFTNGTQMSGTGLIHSSSFDPDLTSYVKCQDIYGNTGTCVAVAGGV